MKKTILTNAARNHILDALWNPFMGIQATIDNVRHNKMSKQEALNKIEMVLRGHDPSFKVRELQKKIHHQISFAK